MIEVIPRRKRNLWVLGPGAKPRNLGLELQPPAEATWWCLEGDSAWHPMPALWRAHQKIPNPKASDRRGKRPPAPGQPTLWQNGSIEAGCVAAARAKPFLRWPGGKTYLREELGRILAGFPCHEHDYCEPTIGGGATFWEFGPRFRTRTIGDLNPNLTDLYRVIRNDVEALIAELQSGAYEYLGKSDPASLARFKHLLHSEPTDQLLRAARYLFVNKACWGGMMRTTRAGKLAASPNLNGAVICDPALLRACALALQGATILRGSAAQVITQARQAHPERRFLLVVDPPYDDDSGKRFVEYSGQFTRRDQAELVHTILRSGYMFIYTNKATEYIIGLFAQVRGIERIILPLRHKLGSRCPLEKELLVHNLAR